MGERGIKSAYWVLVHASDWQPVQSGFMPRKPPQQERLGLKWNPGETLSEALASHPNARQQQSRTGTHPCASGYARGRSAV